MISTLLRAVESPQTAYAVGEPLFRLLGLRKNAPKDIANVRRVLVVALEQIGDVVLTIPFLRELHRALPAGGELTVLVKPATAPLLEACPFIDCVMIFDAGLPSPGFVLRRQIRAIQAMSRYWTRDRFDLAIVSRWDADSTSSIMLAYLSGAVSRIGYSEHVSPLRERVNAGADRLLTKTLTDSSIRHEVHRHLGILDALGITFESDRLDICLTGDDREYAHQILDPIARAPIFAIGVGAGEAKRRWPVDRYRETAEWLIRTAHIGIVVVGGPEDRDAGEQIAAACGEHGVNAAGRTDIRKTAAIIEQAALYIGNDTGVMHLAAAAGKPIVEISCHARSAPVDHPNAPERFGPWGVPFRVVRPETPLPPCSLGCTSPHAHCILSVSTEAVQSAIESLLASLPFR